MCEDSNISWAGHETANATAMLQSRLSKGVFYAPDFRATGLHPPLAHGRASHLRPGNDARSKRSLADGRSLLERREDIEYRALCDAMARVLRGMAARSRPSCGEEGSPRRGRGKMAAGSVASYEFLSKAVTVVGNVGVTQYSVKAIRAVKDGTNETYTSRVTHTWLRTGNTWEIIGGMSAPYDSSGPTW